ncbi:phosphoadenosine phosphosulfate reductase family protein [Dysgonomonas sp. 520]|uniref:phosphoadenosine phosphosulfate reductase family protein n=1 Tax=Dysgonomonas sp. 520 TaxID=2302931 RepID=UPI0013D870C5|nr:phosphoadenosine phosphosulfate reductase family protein [Dysgonomonas sp. 520]NDW10932.1 phosphoadenosine phosphosulfate reductase [Dysgonomonas sp. 520]
MTLQEKINHAITVIRKAEKLALKYSDEGFHLAFSGGKDSQVIYHLAKMAGVKFKAYFYKTSVDPKELLSFIRNNYPDVEWIRPKYTMFQLILKKKNLPTRRSRFCCEYIKEKQGLNRVVIIGIRKSESTNRSKRIEFTSDCKNGCDKNLLSPILEFTDREVWLFLRMFGIEACSVYKKQRRIGCIGCPLNRNMLKELLQYPKIMKVYINTCQKIIDRYPNCKFAQNFKDGQDAFNWWVSDMSVKEYISLRDRQYKIEF